ncbi:MAG TPA: 3-isopropylmalate dehydratase [Burkholderiales bacterium]|nr:3-isopropylmalate dehydratase [Burkholderiales bacterium]
MALEPLRGRVAYIFADDDFDVDQIVGVDHCAEQDMQVLLDVSMQSFDPQFARLARPGDIIVGGQNFGYGHPHYPAMQYMRHLGIRGVIAESFAPGFWQNEINMGFIPITCPGIVANVNRWDEIEMDWTGKLLNRTTGCTLQCEVLSERHRSIIEAGGFIAHLRSKHRSVAA